MKTKSIYLFFALLFTSSLSFAQTDATEESLRQTLKTYIGLVEDLNMVGTLDYVHPKLFETVPREMMEQGMQQLFADPDMNIKMYGGEIKEIHEILKTEEGSYTLVDYTFTMEMTVKTEEAAEEADTTENALGVDPGEFMQSMLAMQYGKENVSYNKETSTFTINVANTMYAIFEKEDSGWKFLEKKENTKGFVMDVVPEKVLEQLK